MTAIRPPLNLLTNALQYIAALSACLMMVHVTADVLSKLILSQPILGTLEVVSLYYMVIAVFLPLAAVQRDREHVFIELFTQKLPPRPRAALDALALALTFALSVLLFWKGLEVAVQKTTVRELSSNVEFFFEVWPGRWMPVVGFGASSLWCAVQLVEDLIFVATGRHPVSIDQKIHEEGM